VRRPIGQQRLDPLPQPVGNAPAVVAVDKTHRLLLWSLVRRPADQGIRRGLHNSYRDTSLALDPGFQAQVRRLSGDSPLYAALRPEALATLYYIADRVHAISGARQPLLVAGAVRDRAYEEKLPKRELAGPRSYSLYATGYSFDIKRRYESPRQAEAFQAMLDRLQALNVIAWKARGDVIHISVSKRAEPLLPLLRGAELEG